MTLQTRRDLLLKALEQNLNNPEVPWASGLQQLVEDIRQDGQNYFLAVSEDSIAQVSYASSLAPKHDNDRRIKTTLGRALRRLYANASLGINDAALERYVAGVLASITTAVTTTDPDKDPFKVLVGQDLAMAYYHGIGGSSCMTGDRGLVELYACNPEVVKLLVYTAGDFTARALLWNTREGITFLERIYPGSRGSHFEIMKAWATSRGYFCRKEQYEVGQTYAELGMEEVTGFRDLSVLLCPPENGRFPYMDTFKYGCIYGDKLLFGTSHEYVWSITEEYARKANSIVGPPRSFVHTDGQNPGLRTYELCHYCGKAITGFVFRTSGGRAACCVTCFSERTRMCGAPECNQVYEIDDEPYFVHTRDGGKERWCPRCAGDRHLTFRCQKCGRVHQKVAGILPKLVLSLCAEAYEPECITEWCDSCATAHGRRCQECGLLRPNEQMEDGTCLHCMNTKKATSPFGVAHSQAIKR